VAEQKNPGGVGLGKVALVAVVGYLLYQYVPYWIERRQGEREHKARLAALPKRSVMSQIFGGIGETF
jgi:hypothetical protein